MDAHWVHHRAGYRCRHGHTAARPQQPGRPRNLYVREDHLLAALPARLAALNLDPVPADQPARLAKALRIHGLIIVCDTTGWALQPDASAISRGHDLISA
jgi:site-specific DNA recombinase